VDRDALSAEEWIEAVIARHSAAMTRPELLKAIRALSARYVERRGTLPERSVLDSAGKRAAFAAYYAPLHFLTVRAFLRAQTTLPAPSMIVDAGCGTGVTSAAWATTVEGVKSIDGVDLHPWALGEARWTWKAFGLRARATRADLVSYLESMEPRVFRPGDSKAAAGGLSRTAIVCGWSLNELPTDKRQRAIASLLELTRRGASAFVIEPVARRLVPWWDGFAQSATAAGGRAEEWRFPPELPAALAELDEAAGFDRQELTARTVTFGGLPDRR
jgi:SAM-dependent methyltransferase